MSTNIAGAPRWNARYAADGYLFGTAPAQFLIDNAPLLVAGNSALVVADGEGRNSVFLAEQGLRVTAMDISTTGVAKARALAAERSVSVDMQVADILSWDWQAEAYDLVVGVFFQFLDPQQRETVFAGMQDALLPGGRLLIHGYRPEQLAYATGGPSVADYMYTEDLLLSEFDGLEVELLKSYDVEVVEGSGHVGMSALIDFIATKPIL